MTRRRFALYAAVAAGFVAAGLPFLKADRFAEPARRALETGLGRRVEINGPIRFSTLARGLSLEQVVIHEDPAAGAEPFAYVTELQATPSIAALFQGKLEFTRLRLIEPSVNLAKSHQGGWNIQPLLDRILATRARDGEPFPELTLEAARVNFRVGEWKSAYYLGDAELRAEANSSTELSIFFEGEPARTDRGLRGIGRLSGRGIVRTRGSGESTLDMSVNLTRTSVSEMLMLTQGRGAGLGGFFSVRAKLSGPLQHLGLKGRAQLEGFERWSWLLGNTAGPGLDFDGLLDLNSQIIDVRTADAPAGLPVTGRLRGFDFMGSPSWIALATVKDAPAESVQALASELGFRLPGDFAWSGKLDGSLNYDSAHEWTGELTLSKAAVRTPALGTAESEELRVRIGPEGLALAPASFVVDGSETVRLEGEFNPRDGSGGFRLQSSGIGLGRLRGIVSALADPDGVALPAANPGASWRGTLRMTQDAANGPQWQTDGELRNASIFISGLTEKLELSRAQLSSTNSTLQVRSFDGKLGEMKISGAYRSPARQRSPHQLTINIPETSASELERLMLPALRRQRGFLARTLGLKPGDPPEWMRARSLQGNVRVGKLEVAGQAIENLALHFVWNGARVEVDEASARAGSGRMDGRFQVELDASEPAYSGTVALTGLDWKGGELEGDAVVESHGAGIAFASALSVKGIFRARDIELRAGDVWKEFDGHFELRRDREAWRWLLSGLELRDGSDVLTGQGASLADGRITLDLSAPGKTVRMAGRLTGAPWENLR